MTERHDSHRGTVQRFCYDDEHRISQVIIEGDAEFTRAEYRYDALGRRTEKQVWRRHTRNAERTQYAWSGLQMVGEYSDSNPDAAVQYIYTENSYEPLARVDSRGEHAEVYWYHTELNGLPEKVTDSSGDIIWQGVSTTWGRSERENSTADWDVPQNLRFQGQYLDRETGLHYNTFRYYDPCGGRYTQMDPIGLLGGLNTYDYVPNTLRFIDPLGLAACGVGSGGKGLGGHRAVDRAAAELDTAAQRASRLLDRGGHMNTAWGKIYQRWANNQYVPQWLKNVSRGNAIQQITDRLTLNNRYLTDIDIKRNVTGSWWGNLRPDYHATLPNGKVAVFDITTPGQAPKIMKYNVDGVTDFLINILY
ncbi:hypothetical protein BBB57_13725 [Kosakonia sacchari]|nr:hypothetical protein BBB57_13725 [Kosakonia sacchari]